MEVVVDEELGTVVSQPQEEQSQPQSQVDQQLEQLNLQTQHQHHQQAEEKIRARMLFGGKKKQKKLTQEEEEEEEMRANKPARNLSKHSQLVLFKVKRRYFPKDFWPIISKSVCSNTIFPDKTW
mmetsp:Transcript_27808/g.43146  ORF Transcript_27808/g.43146 Transcript_27808/m.43146 type:complete len:124 (+) Transcript_27808:2-373(+)